MAMATIVGDYCSAPLPMAIATIIGHYCSAPFPEYFDFKDCHVCGEHLEVEGAYDGLAGCVCVPHGFDMWEVEDLWESGYCGKMCCDEKACMEAFVGKRMKYAEKCISCYALVNLDPKFEEEEDDEEEDDGVEEKEEEDDEADSPGAANCA